MTIVTSEGLKSQIFFNSAFTPTTPQSILPSTSTNFKSSLQAKFPNAIVQSSLEINLLELRIKINSITDYSLPASALDGISSPVQINKDLLLSLWNSQRKQLDIVHKIGATTPPRIRGSLSLVNRGSAELYYLEDFLSIMTTGNLYPLTDDEDILLQLKDAGYGLLTGVDEVLFTGVFTHYLTVIE